MVNCTHFKSILVYDNLKIKNKLKLWNKGWFFYVWIFCKLLFNKKELIYI